MKKVIIGIHGLSNKPPAKLLESWWLQSIREGLVKLRKENLTIPFELVYWADIIYPLPLNPKELDPDNPLYLKQHYTESAGGQRKKQVGLKNKLLRFFESRIDRWYSSENFGPVLKEVSGKVIERYFSDLDAYYGENCVSLIDDKCKAKTAIQARLNTVLHKYRKYDILLIAHSMGSLIAIDVLSKKEMRVRVNTLVTIGSPIGLPFIEDKILAEQKKTNPGIEKPQVPDSIVSSWYNLSDPEDQVALDREIGDDFETNKAGIKVNDFTIYNDYSINGDENHHKSYGYLRTPEVAGIIHDFLTTRLRDRIYRKYNRFTGKIDEGWYKMKNLFRGIK